MRVIVTLLLLVCTATAARAEDPVALNRQKQLFEQEVEAGLRRMFEPSRFVVLQAPRAFYLEGFGLAVQTEVNLYATTSLGAFLPPASLQREVQTAREQKKVRVKELRTKLRALLAAAAAQLTTLAPEDNVAVVVNLFNAASDAGIPAQLVAQVRRQVLLELNSAGKPSDEALARAITFREF